MHILKHPTMRAVLGVAALFVMWQAAAASAGWSVGAGAIHAALLLLTGLAGLAGLAALCGALCRRVRGEDKAVRTETAQCRQRVAHASSEASADMRADAALAEADRLLARISGRAAGGARHDPVGQLGLVQAELMQMQNGAADPAVAARIDMLRTRLELVARAVRKTARTAEAG
jgi:hypothetical protein